MFKQFNRVCSPEEGEGFGGGDPFDLGSAMDDVAASLEKQVEAAPPPPPAAPAPPAPPQLAYPKTWKPEFAQEWETASENLRREALRREEDFYKGIEQYKQHAEYGQRYNKLLSNYLPVFERHGIQHEQVDQLLGNLMQAQFTLAMGTPEQKLELLRGLVEEYQIDPKTLLPAEGAAQPDPALAAFQQKLATIESHLTQREQAELAARQEAAAKEVKAFADAHEDFNVVGPQVAMLLKSHPKLTLEEAYEQALWLNPTTREKAIKKQAEAKAEAERKRAEEAVKASQGSVRTPSRSASVTAPKGTMEDTMRETLAAIKQRS